MQSSPCLWFGTQTTSSVVASHTRSRAQPTAATATSHASGSFLQSAHLGTCEHSSRAPFLTNSNKACIGTERSIGHLLVVVRPVTAKTPLGTCNLQVVYLSQKIGHCPPFFESTTAAKGLSQRRGELLQSTLQLLLALVRISSARDGATTRDRHLEQSFMTLCVCLRYSMLHCYMSISHRAADRETRQRRRG